MTKKRFVKLTMKYGMNRNEAKDLAKYVCVYGSYDTMYAQKCATLALRRMIRSFQKLGITTAEAAKSIGGLYVIGIDLNSDEGMT